MKADQGLGILPEEPALHPRLNVYRVNRILACLFLIASSMARLAYGQDPPSRSLAPCAESVLTSPGVVVEGIKKGEGAGETGLRPGDVLLGWSQGEASGRINLTFDLTALQAERASTGPITLVGKRGTHERSWTLPPGSWHWPGAAVQTRPNLQEPFLSVYLQGKHLAAAGRPLGAAGKWSTAAEHVVASAPGISAWLLLQAAITLGQAHKPVERDKAYWQALQLAAPCGPNFGRELSMAIAWAFKDDGLHSLEYFDQALNAINSEDLTTAWILNRMGNLVMNMGQLSRADEYNRLALEIQQQLAPGGLGMADSWLLIGVTAINRGDLTGATTSLHKALAIQQTIGADADSCNSLRFLAAISMRRKELAMVESYYRQQVSIAERAYPSDILLVDSLGTLAFVLKQLGNLKESKEDSVRAAEIRKRLSAAGDNPYSTPNRQNVVDILTIRGEEAASRGKLNTARRYYLRALKAQNAVLPNSLYAAQLQAELGEVVEALGNSDEAERLYRESLAFQAKETPGSEGHVQVLTALAYNLARKGQSDAAIPMYAEGLDLLEKLTTRHGSTDEARASFRAEYQKHYRQYADLLIGKGKSDVAFEVLERSRARTLLETLLASHVDVYRGADPAFVAKAKALTAELRSKQERRARLLGEQNSDVQIRAIEKEIGDRTAEYQALQEQIRAGDRSYATLTQPLGTEEIQAQLLDPDTLLLEYSLGEERSFLFAVAPDSLQAFPLPKRALIERSARRLYALLTARNRMIEGETPAQRQERCRKAEADYAQTSQVLSRMILGPIAEQLGPRFTKRLLVVADGALAYIPFAMLPDPQISQTAKQAVTPLMVNHEIVNLPSASVLAVLRQQLMARPAAAKAVAVLADPVFEKHDERVRRLRSQHATSASRESKPSGLPGAFSRSPSTALLTRSVSDVGAGGRGGAILTRLRYSRQEADAIMAVTPSGAGMEAVDFAANRATATSNNLSNYRIVHFATHGLLDSAHPELSGLVLSLVDENGNPQDGFLGLQDIYNLNLPADLVVLSACETGLGKEINGEGVIGLTRGFMYAGATRVVASLWKVSDVATARLMASFYQSMVKDELRPAAALRAAQITMWKQRRWRSPYYWAAFQIQGEWK